MVTILAIQSKYQVSILQARNYNAGFMIEGNLSKNFIRRANGHAKIQCHFFAVRTM